MFLDYLSLLLIVTILLRDAALIWVRTAFKTYWAHPVGLSKWLPPPI